jgi:hypothetical protein
MLCLLQCITNAYRAAMWSLPRLSGATTVDDELPPVVFEASSEQRKAPIRDLPTVV